MPIIQPEIPEQQSEPRRFRQGNLGIRYNAPVVPKIKPPKPVKRVRRNYNVQDVQSIAPQRPSMLLQSLGLGAGFVGAQSLAQQVEAAAARQGLRTFFSGYPAGGQFSGWGGTFETALNYAGGDPSRVGVTLLTDTEAANANMRAMLVDTARGSKPVPGAYNYTLSDPSRFVRLGRGVLEGLNRLGGALTAAILAPGLEAAAQNNLPPGYRLYGKPPDV